MFFGTRLGGKPGTGGRERGRWDAELCRSQVSRRVIDRIAKLCQFDFGRFRVGCAEQDSRASFGSTTGGVIRVRLLHPCAKFFPAVSRSQRLRTRMQEAHTDKAAAETLACSGWQIGRASCRERVLVQV